MTETENERLGVGFLCGVGEAGWVLEKMGEGARGRKEKEDSLSNLLRENEVVKGRWKVEGKVGGGGFGAIYQGRDLESGELVAIKVEPRNRPEEILRVEVKVLRLMNKARSKHVAKFHGCGRTGRFSFVVMGLLSKNLSQLRREQRNARFSISTTLRLTIQIISAVQDLHAINFLHRDIKPSNLAMGLTVQTQHTVHILDFGLARRFRNEDGTMRPPRPKPGFRGTLRYASPRVHDGLEASRGDDLISLFYASLEMASGGLPWRSQTDTMRVREMKRTNQGTKLLLRQLPPQLAAFHSAVFAINYFDDPNYEHLTGLLESALEELKVERNSPYDWEIPPTRHPHSIPLHQPSL